MDKIKTGLTALMTGASLMMASNANCADGVTVDHLGVNNTLVRVDSGRKFLLMPVQESNDDATVNILVDGKLDRTLHVRLAKTKVDYCVPFDMEQYAGPVSYTHLTLPTTP